MPIAPPVPQDRLRPRLHTQPPGQPVPHPRRCLPVRLLPSHGWRLRLVYHPGLPTPVQPIDLRHPGGRPRWLMARPGATGPNL